MKYTYEDFLEIVKTLRSENGCPWDKAQTHMSLRSCLVEETFEVLQAIRSFDQKGMSENLKEELGDLLFQIVIHAQIASEEGMFTMEDVVNDIAEKMVYRHPHVFEDPEKYDPDVALKDWNTLKKREKEIRKQKELSEDGSTKISEDASPEISPDVSSETSENEQQDEQSLLNRKKEYLNSLSKIEKFTQELRQLDIDDDPERIAGLEGDLLLEITQISQVCDLPIKKILANRILDGLK